MLNKIVPIVLITLLSGCITPVTLTAVKQGKQESVFLDGSQSLISKKGGTVVQISAPEQFGLGESPHLTVIVTNNSGKNINFSTDNVAAKSEKQSLKVYSYKELKEAEERRQAWQALAVGLSAVGNTMAASNAGYQNTYGSTYGAGGYNTFNATTYNHGAAMAAQSAANAQNQQMISDANAQAEQNMAALNAILKKHTITPNTQYGGLVKVDMPKFDAEEKKRDVNVSIKTGNTTHRFKFVYGKVSLVKSEGDSS